MNKLGLDKQVYLTLAANSASGAFSGNDRPRVDDKLYYPLWWAKREIRIFWEEGIDQSTAVVIKEAIQYVSKRIGLTDFDIRLFGSHPSGIRQIKQATFDGKISDQRLFEICLTEDWRKIRQQGDVFITRRLFGDNLDAWGSASFRYGTMIFALHNERQRNRKFLWKVAVHEACHLFGFFTHCETFEVQQYAYDPACVMHYVCPSATICPKCLDWIKHWWRQILAEVKG